jgi:transposase-like protein
MGCCGQDAKRPTDPVAARAYDRAKVVCCPECNTTVLTGIKGYLRCMKCGKNFKIKDLSPLEI